MRFTFATCAARFGAMALAAAAVSALPQAASADEGGVSFWLPGQFGSLAATPQTPGFTLGGVYYHTSVSSNADRTFPLGGLVVAGLNADANLGVVSPTYVFGSPVLGGQAALSLAGIFGQMESSVSATFTGPRGTVVSGSKSQTITGFGDLYPQAAIRWNHGVSNTMVYVMGDIPVGAYQSSRIANIGIGHAAIDAGGGYTHFNPQTGWEFSATGGLTYNFENGDTDYQNGVDGHLDLGVSKFVKPQLMLGLVGYAYGQLSGDSGSGAKLGDFKARVFGIGPQIGYLFPIAGHQGYLNLKGYGEFGSSNRPDGWNLWLTLAIQPPAPHHSGG